MLGAGKSNLGSVRIGSGISGGVNGAAAGELPPRGYRCSRRCWGASYPMLRALVLPLRCSGRFGCADVAAVVLCGARFLSDVGARFGAVCALAAIAPMFGRVDVVRVT